MAPRVKEALAPHADATAAAATHPTAEAIRAAGKAYNPAEDFRIWRELAQQWKSLAVQFCEMSEGRAADGRPAGETAKELRRLLEIQLTAEPRAIQFAAEDAARRVDEWTARLQSKEAADMLQADRDELERQKELCRAESIRRELAERERQARELEARAEKLREPPRPSPGFIDVSATGFVQRQSAG